MLILQTKCFNGCLSESWILLRLNDRLQFFNHFWTVIEQHDLENLFFDLHIINLIIERD